MTIKLDADIENLKDQTKELEDNENNENLYLYIIAELVKKAEEL